jgi:hypothetical protein
VTALASKLNHEVAKDTKTATKKSEAKLSCSSFVAQLRVFVPSCSIQPPENAVPPIHGDVARLTHKSARHRARRFIFLGKNDEKFFQLRHFLMADVALLTHGGRNRLVMVEAGKTGVWEKGTADAIGGIIVA